MSKLKIIVSLGPATNTDDCLKMIKDRGVDFVRINMSHSSIEDLHFYIGLAEKAGIPFIIDTEGSQVRTGMMSTGSVDFEEGDQVRIHNHPVMGNQTDISLTPTETISELQEGDLIKIDFNTLVLKVSKIDSVEEGFITCKVISAGSAGSNKAVVIDTGTHRELHLPPLTEKDYQAIDIGVKKQIGHIAVSFVRRAADIKLVREKCHNTMKVISKIECKDALENLDEIIEETDYLLLDRGDLSSDIPIEKIPFTQKIILNRANKKGKGVFVATNLLETMIDKYRPTRAEVNDIINTILDGAEGLILAAETAIGKHPIECINIMKKLITHADMVVEREELLKAENHYIIEALEPDYLLSTFSSGTLIEPHGGRLVDRTLKHEPETEYLKSLYSIHVNDKIQMDAEQIALGTFSPLEGFMTEDVLESVLTNMCFPNGLTWTLPIVLDVSDDDAANIKEGSEIVLEGDNGPFAVMYVEEKYRYDRNRFIELLYNTSDERHHGVTLAKGLNPVFLGGKIDLIKRRPAPFKEYELAPRQIRRLLEERGWTRILGFHTRNVIHRSHEFIQMEGMKDASCDGILVHPVIGRKKPGDFATEYIIKTYEIMQKSFYPKGKVIFSTFSTFSRYAGPREAVFTALCRKNFGCSHFVIGRDHTGVGDFYSPYASHEIFDQFTDLGIKVVKFKEVIYSPESENYLHLPDLSKHPEDDIASISGTQEREMLKKTEVPPEWFMRPEISQLLLAGVQAGDEVFVK